MGAIEARTESLTEKFLQIWHRPGSSDIEDSEDLVPILDAPKKPGCYPGWKTEFEYVKFRDETWEVHDVKTLYNRVFKRLWSTHRPAVLAYSTSRKGPIFETKASGKPVGCARGFALLVHGVFPAVHARSCPRCPGRVGAGG